MMCGLSRALASCGGVQRGECGALRSAVSSNEIHVPVVWAHLFLMYACVGVAFMLALYVSFRPTNHPLYVWVAALQGVAMCCGIVIVVVMQKVVLTCVRGACVDIIEAAVSANQVVHCVESRGWAYSATVAAVVGCALALLALCVRILVARMRYAAQIAH